MSSAEVINLAICASNPTELEGTVKALREVGAWGIVPIEWPNAPAIVDAIKSAALVLIAGECDR